LKEDKTLPKPLKFSGRVVRASDTAGGFFLRGRGVGGGNVINNVAAMPRRRLFFWTWIV